MSVEGDILRAVSKITADCNLEGPDDIRVRSGPIYASGNDDRGYFFVNVTSGEKVKAQNHLLHEAGHLVRLFYEETQNVGLELDEAMIRVAQLVSENVSDKGILGENYLKLWSLLLAKNVSDELVGCYFGFDFDDQDAISQVRQIRFQELLLTFRNSLQGWEKEIRNIMYTPEGFDKQTDFLYVAKFTGKSIGGILGHILAVEQASPREIMLHDSMKIFESIKRLSELEQFPNNLEIFLQETGVLSIPEN